MEARVGPWRRAFRMRFGLASSWLSLPDGYLFLTFGTQRAFEQWTTLRFRDVMS